MIDFIGDIHGHADKLKALLDKLGYTSISGGSDYSHKHSKVIFLGDYIDRGPQIKETLDIVRRMVDSGKAIALMGNHEYNAICYHTKNKDGIPLREHSLKNINQHCETIRQFDDNEKELDGHIQWFKTLPLFIETETYRAVHACWDYDKIRFLQGKLSNWRLTDELINESSGKGSELYEAVDRVLKGREIELPGSQKFLDKDGVDRSEIRIKWWEDPSRTTIKQLSIEPREDIPDEKLPPEKLDYYKEDDKSVFFGHYWLTGDPVLFRNNICCLDYSVAKNGLLVAYRFDEESKLKNNKLVYV